MDLTHSMNKERRLCLIGSDAMVTVYQKTRRDNPGESNLHSYLSEKPRITYYLKSICEIKT
jgi:hypothetical protein